MQTVDLNNNEDFKYFFMRNRAEFDQLDRSSTGQSAFDAIRVTGDFLDTIGVEEESFKGPDGQVFKRDDYISIDRHQAVEDLDDKGLPVDVNKHITSIPKEQFEKNYEQMSFLPINEDKGRLKEEFDVPDIDLSSNEENKNDAPKNDSQKQNRRPE